MERSTPQTEEEADTSQAHNHTKPSQILTEVALGGPRLWAAILELVGELLEDGLMSPAKFIRN